MATNYCENDKILSQNNDLVHQNNDFVSLKLDSQNDEILSKKKVKIM